MAKLNFILGAIAKDLTQSQITADLSSMEYLAQYRQHDYLKYMDIPRVSVRDVNIKLRFAIDNIEGETYSDNAITMSSEKWNDNLLNKVLPETIDDVTADVSTQDKLKIALKQFSPKALPVRHSFKKAFDGNNNDLVAESANDLLETLKDISKTAGVRLPPDNKIKASLKSKISASYENSKNDLKKMAVARSAADLDLNIIIENSKLANVRQEEIHEITLSLDIDYINSTGNQQTKNKE